MMAQRYQMRPDEYALVVTEGMFTLDVLAWFESFSTPLRMLLPTKKGPAGDASRAQAFSRGGQSSSDVPSAYSSRVRQGANVRFVDLDELDTPETAKQLAAAFSPAGLGLPNAGKDRYERLLKKIATKGRSLDARKLGAPTKRAVEAKPPGA